MRQSARVSFGHEAQTSTVRYAGVVVFWRTPQRDWGWICTDRPGRYVFAHCADAHRALTPGQRVSFRVGHDSRGRRKAVAVQLEATR